VALPPTPHIIDNPNLLFDLFYLGSEFVYTIIRKSAPSYEVGTILSLPLLMPFVGLSADIVYMPLVLSQGTAIAFNVVILPEALRIFLLLFDMILKTFYVSIDCPYGIG